MSSEPPTTTILFRPVGPKELELIEATGNRRFPPRLPDQPIFYPVCNEEYATQIARDWNVPSSGAGFVTRFRVRSAFLGKYDVHVVGGRTHAESLTLAEYIDGVVQNAAKFDEVELKIKGETGEKKAVSLVAEMIRTGLTRKMW